MILSTEQVINHINGLITTAIKLMIKLAIKLNKKLSYCWETVRRESMPRVAEMDVEMTS